MSTEIRVEFPVDFVMPTTPELYAGVLEFRKQKTEQIEISPFSGGGLVKVIGRFVPAEIVFDGEESLLAFKLACETWHNVITLAITRRP